MTRIDLKTNTRQKLAAQVTKLPHQSDWSVMVVAVVELAHAGLLFAGPVVLLSVILAAVWR